MSAGVCLSVDLPVSHCGLDTASTSAPIGLMVSSKIDFRRSVSYPEPLIAGLSIAKLGKTSVTYRVGVWAAHVADTRRFDSPPAEWHGLEPVNDVRVALPWAPLTPAGRIGRGRADARLCRPENAEAGTAA